MLQLGMNLTLGPADTLKKVQTPDLVKYIKNGSFDLKTKVEQLRRIQALDFRKYQDLKKSLPYFTCGIFHPPIRKTENFAYAESFVLDFDHLSSKELTPGWLKEKLSGDERTQMIFISPGYDGLKVLFTLSHRITDPVKFSLFYKLFARQFTSEYGIEQVMDSSTSDVTRACFLSYDPEIFYNTNPLLVNPDSYIDFDSAEQVEEAEKMYTDTPPASTQPDQGLNDVEKDNLTKEILDSIRQKLNPKAIIRREKQIFVPQRLNDLEKLIREEADDIGLTVSGVKNINYGKQITFSLDLMVGEVNIFYGKRGFTVVKSSKSGCSEELNDLAYDFVLSILQ